MIRSVKIITSLWLLINLGQWSGKIWDPDNDKRSDQDILRTWRIQNFKRLLKYPPCFMCWGAYLPCRWHLTIMAQSHCDLAGHQNSNSNRAEHRTRVGEIRVMLLFGLDQRWEREEGNTRWIPSQMTFPGTRAASCPELREAAGNVSEQSYPRDEEVGTFSPTTKVPFGSLTLHHSKLSCCLRGNFRCWAGARGTTPAARRDGESWEEARGAPAAPTTSRESEGQGMVTNHRSPGFQKRENWDL